MAWALPRKRLWRNYFNFVQLAARPGRPVRRAVCAGVLGNVLARGLLGRKRGCSHWIAMRVTPT
jgi:hypothetical protein